MIIPISLVRKLLKEIQTSPGLTAWQSRNQGLSPSQINLQSSLEVGENRKTGKKAGVLGRGTAYAQAEARRESRGRAGMSPVEMGKKGDGSPPVGQRRHSPNKAG